MPVIGHFEVKSITTRGESADITLQALPAADQEGAGITTWDSTVTAGSNAGVLELRKIASALLGSVEVGKVYPISVGAAIV